MDSMIRTKVDKPVLLGSRLAPLDRLLDGWGVSIDLQNPPWPGGYTPNTEDGTVIQRVSKYLRQEHGVKLFSMDRKYLGLELAQASVFPVLWIEVDDNWEFWRGQVNDERSGLWRYARQLRPILRNLSAKVVRIYDSPTHQCGRAFLLKGTQGELAAILPHGIDTDILYHALIEAGYTDLPANPVLAELPVGWTVDVASDIWRSLPRMATVLCDRDVPLGEEVTFYNKAVIDTRYSAPYLFCEICFERIRKQHVRRINGGWDYASHVCEKCVDTLNSRQKTILSQTNIYLHGRLDGAEPEPEPAQQPLPNMTSGYESILDEYEGTNAIELFGSMDAALAVWGWPRHFDAPPGWGDLVTTIPYSGTLLRLPISDHRRSEVESVMARRATTVQMRERTRTIEGAVTNAVERLSNYAHRSFPHRASLAEGTAVARLVQLGRNDDAARMVEILSSTQDYPLLSVVKMAWLVFCWIGEESLLDSVLDVSDQESTMAKRLAATILGVCGVPRTQIACLSDEHLMSAACLAVENAAGLAASLGDSACYGNTEDDEELDPVY